MQPIEPANPSMFSRWWHETGKHIKKEENENVERFNRRLAYAAFYGYNLKELDLKQNER